MSKDKEPEPTSKPDDLEPEAGKPDSEAPPCDDEKTLQEATGLVTE
ncbi:MAG: hypothetical protein V7641_5009 [Blastocatellia bacterium]